MAAALAKGETLIAGAAREPEIVDLADCLIAMGAKIEGAGTSNIRIEGVPVLHGASHGIIPDRIEAGTYAMAAGVTGGSILLQERAARLLRRRQGGDRGRGHGAGRRSTAGCWRGSPTAGSRAATP